MEKGKTDKGTIQVAIFKEMGKKSTRLDHRQPSINTFFGNSSLERRSEGSEEGNNSHQPPKVEPLLCAWLTHDETTSSRKKTAHSPRASLYNWQVARIPEVKELLGTTFVTAEGHRMRVEWASIYLTEDSVDRVLASGYCLCSCHIFVCLPADLCEEDTRKARQDGCSPHWRYYFQLHNKSFAVASDKVLSTLIPAHYAASILSHVPESNIELVRHPLHPEEYIPLPALPAFIYQSQKYKDSLSSNPHDTLSTKDSNNNSPPLKKDMSEVTNELLKKQAAKKATSAPSSSSKANPKNPPTPSPAPKQQQREEPPAQTQEDDDVDYDSSDIGPAVSAKTSTKAAAPSVPSQAKKKEAAKRAEKEAEEDEEEGESEEDGAYHPPQSNKEDEDAEEGEEEEDSQDEKKPIPHPHRLTQIMSTVDEEDLQQQEKQSSNYKKPNGKTLNGEVTRSKVIKAATTPVSSLKSKSKAPPSSSQEEKPSKDGGAATKRLKVKGKEEKTKAFQAQLERVTKRHKEKVLELIAKGKPVPNPFAGATIESMRPKIRHYLQYMIHYGQNIEGVKKNIPDPLPFVVKTDTGYSQEEFNNDAFKDAVQMQYCFDSDIIPMVHSHDKQDAPKKEEEESVIEF